MDRLRTGKIPAFRTASAGRAAGMRGVAHVQLSGQVHHAGDVLRSVFAADGAAEPDREKRTGALNQLPFTNWRPSWSIS